MTAAAATKPAHYPNEDSFIVDTKLGLFAVFDGIGGFEGGAAAAKIAAKIILRSFKDREFVSENSDTKIFLKKILAEAAKEIAKDGAANGRLNQGTTATVVKTDKEKITIANVGDSRCYGITKRNQLIKLSKDHSLLTELVTKGKIPAEIAEKIDQAASVKDLTEQGLAIFSSRNVLTVALVYGFDAADVNINEVNSADFKMLILTTDGVHDNLTEEEIKTLLFQNGNLDKIAKNLVKSAYQVSRQNTLRSKPDDATAVVVKI